MFGLSKTAYGGGFLKDTPLIAKISEYIELNKLGFHTPGHQQGRGMSTSLKKVLGSRFLAGDLTEVPGLDNLRNPQECLRETQGLAATVYGARKTFFLVNGSTVGIEAAILGLNRQGGKVVVTRNAHISVLNGLILSGGQPILIPAVLEPCWGLALGPDLAATRQIIANTSGVDLAIFTQPSYQGTGLDPQEFKAIASLKQIPLLCDEAHGAHLFFQNRLSLSAQREGVDVVVQSTHKTLGALTQASMLHINRPDLITPIQEALETLQTTSPSYLLLASLDAVQAQMGQAGEQLVAKGWEIAENLRAEIRKMGAYRLLEDELAGPWQQDPSKLVLSAASFGLSGWELGEILCHKYGIIVELSDYYYCLFLITYGHRKRDLHQLVSALTDIWRNYRKTPLPSLRLGLDLYQSTQQVAYTPRQVYQASKESIAVSEARGRLAGRALTIYPPGIPLLWPGQEITAEHQEYLAWAASNRLPIHGLAEEDKIFVMKTE